jgi:hypothetical protein
MMTEMCNKFFITFFLFILLKNSWETETGDEGDVIKSVQRSLNRSVVQWTISKQEAMSELKNLPLVTCSKIIETVSLSGVSRLQLEPNLSNTTFFLRFKNIDHTYWRIWSAKCDSGV